MLFAVENQITKPINLGSGEGYSIKKVVDMVVKHSGKDLEVKWLTDKPNGDAIRLFDMTRAKSYGFDISVSLEEGIKKTTEWFKNNKEILDKRYNAFVDH
jgi:GDP-L-fucose synthase